MDTEKTVIIAPYGLKPDGTAWPPNPTQAKVLEFVDKVRQGINPKTDQPFTADDGVPVLLLIGGVGSGKSRAVLAPVIETLLEIPNLRVLWGRHDFKDIKLSIMDKFLEIMPTEIITDKSEQYHWYDIAQHGGGKARIFFNGLKDLSGLSSQEFGVIAVTEAYEITEQAYRTLKRRVRQANVINLILMESEAPNEDHWLAKLTNPESPDYDPDITLFQLSTYENWANLPRSYCASLESMPESWKKKYLEGGYGFIPDGDPFYQCFKEALHKKELESIKGKELILGWDYGFRHPACLITQIDAKGRWLLLRQIIGSNITIDHFGDVVKTYLNQHFPSYSAIGYGDPAGDQATDKSEETSVSILRNKGFSVTSRGSTYRDRKEIIEGKLGTLIDGLPALLVDTSCKTVIDGFLGGYHYPMIQQGQQWTTIKTEAPYKDGFYEHIMNCMEYIAVNIFKAIKRSDQNNFYKIARVREVRNMQNAGLSFSG